MWRRGCGSGSGWCGGRVGLPCLACEELISFSCAVSVGSGAVLLTCVPEFLEHFECSKNCVSISFPEKIPHFPGKNPPFAGNARPAVEDRATLAPTTTENQIVARRSSFAHVKAAGANGDVRATKLANEPSGTRAGVEIEEWHPLRVSVNELAENCMRKTKFNQPGPNA